MLWVTIFVAMGVSLFLNLIRFWFFNFCIGLCPSDVASVQGTVPVLATEAHNARRSGQWGVIKTTGEGDC